MKIIQKLAILSLLVSFGCIIANSSPTNAIPANAPAGSNLEQRIKQRKSEQEINLDTKQLARVAQRCTASQTKVRTIQDQLNPILTNRSKVYQRIDAKIWIAIGQLKLAEKDTFKLEKERATLARYVALFDETGAQYKQTLDDMVVMNCKADPVGFIALVETAREYHKELRKQITDIQTYTVDTIKTSLSEFSAALQPKAATEQKEGN